MKVGHLKTVENKLRKVGNIGSEAESYIMVWVVDETGGMLPLLMTSGELDKVVIRANKQPEDIPEPPKKSLFSRLFGWLG